MSDRNNLTSSLFVTFFVLSCLLLSGQSHAATQIINSNGGQCAFDSSNGGLKVYVGDNSQFQVERCSADGVNSGSRQYYSTSAIPPSGSVYNSIYLRVGSTVFGASGLQAVNTAWTSISSSGGSTLGDGSVITVYSAVTGGLTYTVTQTVTYIFPNDFYSVKLDVGVPVGNTQDVRLYSWTDLMLDGNDNGTCSRIAVFPEYLVADNTAGTMYAGYRQRSVSNHWDRYQCGNWSAAPSTYINSAGSGDLPNDAAPTYTDVGAAVQWNIGSVSNTTFTADYDFVFSLTEPTLTKRYGPDDGDVDHTMGVGDTTTLTFDITNRPGNPAQGPLSFTETLPLNVTIVGTPAASQCGGTVTTGTSGGRGTITLAGGQMTGGTQSCTVVADVTSVTAGVYDDPSTNISNINELKNIAQAELTVTAAVESSACATGVDTDGDGIANACDLDDDNDGIIDKNEGVTRNYQWTTWNASSGNAITGTAFGIGVSYTSSQTVETTSSLYHHATVPSEYLVPDSTSIKNTVASDNTITFSQPVENPLFVFTSVGNPSTSVPVIFNKDIQVLWGTGEAGGAYTVDSLRQFTANEGFLVVRVPGTHSSVSFQYTANENYANFTFGYAATTAIDSDGDGIDDYLDLDSDNDGIPDTIEAQTTASYLVAVNIDTDNDGLDNAFDLDDNNTAEAASAGLTPVNTDGDTQNDILDLDSDNDGLTDLAESGLSLLDADANGKTDGVVGTNGLDNEGEAADTYVDNNGSSHDGTNFLLADFDNDTAANGSDAVPLTKDLSYRDIERDRSDAPTSFGEATHSLVSGLKLGVTVDSDGTSIESNDASGDGSDDDGVFTDAALTTGFQDASLNLEDSVTLYVPVTGSGKLSAWIDWNGDGDFADLGEQIANAVAGADETLAVVVNVPLSATLATAYARFRFSSDTAASTPTGAASDGEVEDYQIIIANNAVAPTAPAIAYCSNTWVLDNGVYRSITNQGVVISASTTASSGAAWSFSPNDAFNETGSFSLSTLNGSPSLSTVFTWDTSPEDGRLANAATDAATGTLTFAFGVPVKNPIIHIDRQGGYGSSSAATPMGLSNSSIITPNTANSAATFTRLAGTTHFDVTTNTIQRTPNETMQETGVTGLSGVDSSVHTAMGSVQVNGTYNNLSLDFSGVGVEGAGADGIEFIVCAEPYDYGDAPTNYGEATHKIPEIPIVYLGDIAPDHEPQIQNTANGGADGLGDDQNDSDDEDAYDTLPAIWTTQSQYRLKVDCSDQGAYVSGWVDFNQNNQFDAGERNTDYPTRCNVSGNVTLNWTGLSGLSPGTTYARLRIASDSVEASTATGTATDGEVEDYPVIIQAPGATPGVCVGEPSWLNTSGQSADPTSNWALNWAERGINANVSFSTTMTGNNAKWTAAPAKAFTESAFANRFGSPGYGVNLNYPEDLSGAGETSAYFTFDKSLPANTYMVIRDIDATDESITFSGNNLGSLPAPSLWETQSPLNATANSPSLFASWDSVSQQIVTLSDGPNNDQEAYVWPVTGLTSIRATYQTYAGSANIGFVSCVPQDYGDAPESYKTSKANAGPRHGIINGVYLGSNTPDADIDGQASIAANGDGADEDGISTLAALTTSDRTYSATVKASNDTSSQATLTAWIDFDRNGTFDADEVAIQPVPAGSNQTSFTLNWSNIPVDIQTGDTYVRVRLTTDSLNNREPNGPKLDGEVEDYTITITTAGVTVSGRVFNDANVSAANDSGEVGVTQLPVVLIKIETSPVNNRCVSARTDGNGNYRFEDVVPGTYQVYEASRESVPVPRNCSIASAKNPGSYRSTTDNVRAEFTVTTSDITKQDFGDVKLPVFEPDNSAQILPGNVLFYAHKFTTRAKGSVSFASASSGNRSSGWSSILYRDANCDGKLNQSDGTTPIGTSAISVSALDNICVINKVYAPANVAANDQYIQTITADFNYNNAIAGTLALKVQDVTVAQQVQAPALPATPAVVAADAVEAQEEQPATSGTAATETTPAVPATPYIPATDPIPAQPAAAATPVTPAVGPSRLELRKTVQNTTQNTPETSTVNQAAPGDTLKYRIYYSNTGTGPLTELIVNDNAQAYTEIKAGTAVCNTMPAEITSCTPVISGDRVSWEFDGPLIGGKSGFVSYDVVIDE